MKKIAVFGMTSNYGGVESFIMNYYRNTDRTKIQFDFFVYTAEPAYADEIKALGGRIFIITARGKNFFACRKETLQLLKENNYCTVWSNLCYLSDITILQCAKKLNIKKRIVHAHSNMLMSDKLNGFLHMLNRRIIKNTATDFWACSKAAGEYFYEKNILQSPAFKVIPNAINLDNYSFNEKTRLQKRKELGLDGKLVIGNVSRLHFQKNQSFLIDIFNEIKKNSENAVLIIAGAGEEKKRLEDKITALNLNDSALLLGNRTDIAELMQAMDIFVLPSLFEGLGIVLIEAQAAGLPCFTSKDVVPQEAMLTSLLKYISLDETANGWAKQITAADISAPRALYTDEIKKKGYDIKSAAAFLSEYF